MNQEKVKIKMCFTRSVFLNRLQNKSNCETTSSSLFAVLDLLLLAKVSLALVSKINTITQMQATYASSEVVKTGINS